MSSRVRAELACQWLPVRRNLVWLCQEGKREDIAENRKGSTIARCPAHESIRHGLSILDYATPHWQACSTQNLRRYVIIKKTKISGIRFGELKNVTTIKRFDY